jgi:hypothetical protein
MALENFVRTVLLGDLRRMVYEAKLHYLAFGTIAVGIEFLGACDDPEPFISDKRGLSTKRFKAGIKRMARIDPRYSTYNEPSSDFNLYKHLRCGTTHIMRPGGRIAFSERAHDDVGPEQHLTIVKDDQHRDKLLLVSEDFYDDFAKCCEMLIAELPGMTEPKLKSPYLWVGDVRKWLFRVSCGY